MTTAQKITRIVQLMHEGRIIIKDIDAQYELKEML